jgi:phenylpyruvate tautomerase PptA (4-oxalocrotonate tautomerase family)
MSKHSLTRRLFLFLWHRYVDGLDAGRAADLAGISEEEFLAHRAERSRFYRMAEERIKQSLPPEALETYARVAQFRILSGTARDSATASVAARVLDAAAEATGAPTNITFVIQDADMAERVNDLAFDACSRPGPSTVVGNAATIAPPSPPASPKRRTGGFTQNKPPVFNAPAVAVAKGFKPPSEPASHE